MKKKWVVVSLIFAISSPSFAVSNEEMDQALSDLNKTLSEGRQPAGNTETGKMKLQLRPGRTKIMSLENGTVEESNPDSNETLSLENAQSTNPEN